MAYIRIKMQFWHLQPVFHIHNIGYWLNPPGIISLELPTVNKFVNLSNNKLINVNEIGETQLQQICNFIKNYYVMHKSAKYTPTLDDIHAYLQHSTHPAFFNIYTETKLLFANGEPLENKDSELISVISARPLNITLRDKSTSKGKSKKGMTTTSVLYYIDNLCVHPGQRNKGIAPQVIQTLYHTLSRANQNINLYMFKREGQLMAIVPLVCFETYCFNVSRVEETRIATLLSPALSLVEITKNQMNLLHFFLKEQIKQFECVILTDVSSLLHLLNTEKLIIYAIIANGEIIAIYVFRILNLYYDEVKTIECIAIVSNCTEHETLLAGFYTSLVKLKTCLKLQMLNLLIENTAHSDAVIKSMLINNNNNNNSMVEYKFKNPTAFFLYNYACYSLSASKTLLIY
jgi:hypothetical protein